MMKIPGYRIEEEIHAGATSTIYRAVREDDGARVVLKHLSAPTPTAGDLARYRYAWELASGLEADGVCRYLDLVEHDRRPVLVMEDAGGSSLRTLLARAPLPTEEALRLAAAVTRALGELHRHGIVHRDLNPGNVVVTPDGDARIIDLDIASRLSRETAAGGHPTTIQGTLTHIAPEQTGRMNRSIDHRADLYALGVTLYEMLTGRLPFDPDDAMALVHGHLAVTPRTPREVASEVPEGVSRLVMKLLSKAPEGRYQSARGLVADLERCLETLEATGDIPAFDLGRRDLAPTLRLSRHLYGREDDTQDLLRAFERVGRGGCELLLVTGLPGVGKSSLVREIHKPITLASGRFVSGKHDPLDNAPYAALIEALRDLVRDILTEPRERVRAWENVLTTALGAAAGLIVEVIPEAELIVGPQPPVPRLPPLEARNRFQLLFRRFVRCFADEDHPLCIFLDDLQWADAASLQLVQALLTDPDASHMLLVGAYRQEEVGDAHPLALVLAELEEAEESVAYCGPSEPETVSSRSAFDGSVVEPVGSAEGSRASRWAEAAGSRDGSICATGSRAPVETLEIRPLDLPDLRRMVADAVSRRVDEVDDLARAIFAKTRGNPFFVERFLLTLQEEGALWLDLAAPRWEWDLDRVRDMGVTEHVADLMARRLSRLDERPRGLLEVAACIGARFDLQTLAAASGRDPAEVASNLWDLIGDELIAPVGDAYRLAGLLRSGEDASHLPRVPYRFVHDRIQEAAYALVPEEERPALHLRLGRLLLDDAGEEGPGARLFGVVHHLEAGRTLLTDPDERRRVAVLQGRAGRKAMDSAAFREALRYLTVGLELLPDDAWDRDYALTFDLHHDQAQAAVMAGHFDFAAGVIERSLEAARTRADRVELHILRIRLLSRMNDYGGAVDAGLEGLAEFGFEPPASPDGWQAAIAEETGHLQEALADVDVPALAEAPMMEDEDVVLQVRLLSHIGTPAHTRRDVFAFVNTRIVRLSVLHGNAPDSPLSYVLYGMMACMMDQPAMGDAFARTGMALNQRLGQVSTEAVLLHLYGAFVCHWSHPLRQAKRVLHDAHRLALEHGNYESAGYTLFNMGWAALVCGDELQGAVAEAERLVAVARGTLEHADIAHVLLWSQHQMLRLRGDDAAREALDARGLDEASLLDAVAHFEGFVMADHAQRLMAAVHLEDTEAAAEAAEATLPGLEWLAGSLWMPEVLLYHGLVLADRAIEAEGDARGEMIETLGGHLEKLEAWASHCPGSFEHRRLLLAAERETLEANPQEAGILYDRAIEAAQEAGHPHVEGLAARRAAQFYQRRGRERVARGYLTDAHYAYVRWGADAVVERLEERYGFLRRRPVEGPARTSTSTDSLSLDLETVVRATRAISSEIVLDDLLRTLMRTVLESAGAQRGALLLRHGDELRVEAHVEAEGEEPSVLTSLPLDEDLVCPSIVRFVERAQRRVVLGDATASERFGTDPCVVRRRPRSVLCTPVVNQGGLVGVLYLENNLATEAFTESRCALLDMLASQAAVSISNAQLYRQQERLTESMTRFLPTEFMRLLDKESILDVQLGDAVERDMCVMFSDIRSFTSISDRMSPEEIFRYLNGFLERVGPVIREHGGFIDKYIGDAVMALFPGPAEEAMASAVAIHEATSRYNEALDESGDPPVRIGVGLHRGSLILGTIGESRRLDGTVISDTVNVAARLEELTKSLDASIVVSGEVFDRLPDPDAHPHRCLGSLRLRGKKEPTRLYEIFVPGDGERLERYQATREDFEAAVDAWLGGDTASAASHLERVLAAAPDDAAARWMADEVSREGAEGVEKTR
ncbi:MAG: AAA family ATPase [Myxococcota bacterium]